MAILRISLVRSIWPLAAMLAVAGADAGLAIAGSEGEERAAPFLAPLDRRPTEPRRAGRRQMAVELPSGLVLQFGGDGAGGAQGAVYMRTMLGLFIGAQGGVSGHSGGAQATLGVKLRF